MNRWPNEPDPPPCPKCGGTKVAARIHAVMSSSAPPEYEPYYLCLKRKCRHVWARGVETVGYACRRLFPKGSLEWYIFQVYNHWDRDESLRELRDKERRQRFEPHPNYRYDAPVDGCKCWWCERERLARARLELIGLSALYRPGPIPTFEQMKVMMSGHFFSSGDPAEYVPET